MLRDIYKRAICWLASYHKCLLIARDNHLRMGLPVRDYLFRYLFGVVCFANTHDDEVVLGLLASRSDRGGCTDKIQTRIKRQQYIPAGGPPATPCVFSVDPIAFCVGLSSPRNSCNRAVLSLKWGFASYHLVHIGVIIRHYHSHR